MACVPIHTEEVRGLDAVAQPRLEHEIDYLEVLRSSSEFPRPVPPRTIWQKAVHKVTVRPLRSQELDDATDPSA
jgi:hypothetical protein